MNLAWHRSFVRQFCVSDRHEYFLGHSVKYLVPNWNIHGIMVTNQFSHIIKEYIERRHGEPFKFLFLPKMGLLGSQAVLEKKVQFWIMSNFLAPFFQLFMGKNLFFYIYFYIAASALKSCLIKKWKKLKKFLEEFFLD